MKHHHNNSAFLTILLVLILVSLSCTFPVSNVPVDNTPQVCPTCEPCSACDNAIILMPEITETQEVEIVATRTLMPTETSIPTITQIPTNIPVDYLYQLQPGTPSYIPNIHHLEAGDQWLGIGGQVFGLDGLPVEYIVVRVQGILDGKTVDLTSMTGAAEIYGPGGYELKLADFGINSTDSLTITLFDLQSQQVSAAIPFATFDNPDQLQIVINFVHR